MAKTEKTKYVFVGTFINGEEYSGSAENERSLKFELEKISKNQSARLPHKITCDGVDVTEQFVEF